MKEYHKIENVFRRDMENGGKTLLDGQWANPAFGYLAGCEWVFTEKVDGTNIRVMFTPHEGIRFGGKTDAAQIPAPLANSLNEIFLPQRETFEATFADGVCLYGEGYGAKIQKGGGNYRPDQGFVLFDVRVGDWWLERTSVEGVADTLGLDVVPVVGRGTLREGVEMVRSGFSSQWGDFTAEGLVARPAMELKTRSGNRIITKIKCRDFPNA